MKVRFRMYIELYFYKAPSSSNFHCVIRNARSLSLSVTFTFSIEFLLLAKHLQKIVHIKAAELNFQRKQPSIMLCDLQPIFALIFFKGSGIALLSFKY